MPGSLHLILPGLLGPLPKAAARWEALDRPLPALERLLARSRRQTQVFSDPYEMAASAFGFESEGELPAGALGLLGDGLDPGGSVWLCADPVHLRADRDRLMLFPPESLSLQASEAQALVAECNRFLVQDRLELVAPHPTRWYLRLPAMPAMRTAATINAAHRYIDDYLPTGADARRWSALGTELQMLLHISGANLEREAGGRPTANSLWLWGPGALPAAVSTRYRRVLSDEPVLRGLALRAGVAAAEPGERFTPPGEGDTLLFSLRLQQALRAGDFENWLREVESLSAGWVAPALEALGRGELTELLVSTGQARFRLGRQDLRRFWRRPRHWRRHLEWEDA